MAVSSSCPTLHDRLYLCSIRISRTLSANQMFFAVTSPPDQRGRKQRVRTALISDSAEPVHVFSLLLLHPCDPITDVLRAEKTVFVCQALKFPSLPPERQEGKVWGFSRNQGCYFPQTGGCSGITLTPKRECLERRYEKSIAGKNRGHFK